ncbi:MAG: XRE family transcriptional regulator [Bacteroidetes bacterium]|nr:XRE family transcriptional regulator [Bacteroidota bacterium]
MPPEIQINPKMVVLARESRGISQKDIAEKLGTSPTFICKVETDSRTLSEETLGKMSKLLKYPADFFYQEGEAYIPMSLNYRKRDHVSAKVLVPLEAQINLYRLHIESISEKLKLKEVNVPVLDLKKHETTEQVAKQLRKFWKMPKGPVENLTELLEENGIIVISFDFGTERVDSRTIFTKDKLPVICVNKLHLADRQRFSLAYELGHLVMHTGTMPSFDRDISHEANMFAAGFLLPESEIKKDLSRQGRDPSSGGEKDITVPLLGELKRKWKVSMQSLLFRAADLGFLTDNQKRYLLQQFNQMQIRRREPPELDFPQEKPKLMRDLITKYKNAHKFSVKEMAASLHLGEEDFMSRYGE